MNSNKELFGARIKEIRENRKLSQEQLAKLVEMDSRQLSRIETGKSFTTIENIVKIANILNVKISDLFMMEHKQERNTLIKQINDYLGTASDKEIELIYKLVYSIIK